MGKNNSGSKLFNHPLHPIITHFPMALWMVSLLWDFLGLWRGDPLWWSFSYWSIAFGLLFAFLALVTGLTDYVKIPQGSLAERIAMRHLLVVIAAAALYTGSFFFRWGSVIPSGIHLMFAISFSILGFILLLIGGWYGGQLVYRFGVGIHNSELNKPRK